MKPNTKQTNDRRLPKVLAYKHLRIQVTASLPIQPIALNKDATSSTSATSKKFKQNYFFNKHNYQATTSYSEILGGRGWELEILQIFFHLFIIYSTVVLFTERGLISPIPCM